jgi:hypothetical protein
MEFHGGTYVRQGHGESPEIALSAWVRTASEDDFDWAGQRAELLEQLEGQQAVPVDGCQNVWCVCGSLREHLFLIHIVATDSGASEGTQVAEAQLERTASDARRWGWGDRW